MAALGPTQGLCGAGMRDASSFWGKFSVQGTAVAVAGVGFGLSKLLSEPAVPLQFLKVVLKGSPLVHSISVSSSTPLQDPFP